MKRDDGERRALARLPQNASYEVGYGRPPAATRFVKGKSGNPAGRPRGSRAAPKPAPHEERLKAIIMDEAYRTILVNDPSGPVSVPIVQAVVRSLAVNAAKGRHRSQELFTTLLSETERANRRLHDEFLNAAMEYKVQWERELDRRARLGIDAPPPLPHPDDVIIDMQTGSVRFTGPVTKAEVEELARWKKQRDMFAKELAELRRLAASARGKAPARLAREIRKTEKVIAIIDAALKSGRIPRSFPDLALHAV